MSDNETPGCHGDALTRPARQTQMAADIFRTIWNDATGIDLEAPDDPQEDPVASDLLD